MYKEHPLNQNKKINIGPLVLAVITTLIFCYCHIYLWGDTVASYTNYFISIFVWPLVVSVIIGLLFAFAFPFVRTSKKTVCIMAMVPALLSLAFSAMVYFVLAYAPH